MIRHEVDDGCKGILYDMFPAAFRDAWVSVCGDCGRLVYIDSIKLITEYPIKELANVPR